MDRESIIGDLKKYAGGSWTANTQKVTLDIAQIPIATPVITGTRGRPRKEVAPEPVNTAFVQALVQAPVREPVLTATDIAAKVRPPMTVVMTDGVISPDNATLRIRCEHGHTHIAFLKDILVADGDVNCKTCKYGSKFAVMVREILESILKIPFSISDKTTRGKQQTCEFVNDEHLVAVECCRTNNIVVPPEIINDKLILSITYSTSRKKIRAALLEMLKGQRDWFLDELQEAIDVAISQEVPKKTGRAAPKIFNKDPMPYTMDAADTAVATRRISNPLLAKMQMNIVDNETAESLCIENCQN